MKKHLIAVLPTLVASLLLNSALGQTQQQNVNHKNYDIAHIAARRETAPVSVVAARDYLEAMTKARATTSATASQPCTNFLVSAPAIENLVDNTNVYLYTGCDIPIGTWMIVEENYNDGSGGTQVWETTQDAPSGDIIEWFPNSALPVGGAVFTITIVPPDLQAVRYQTTFDAPSPFQMAYEQVTVLASGAIQRTITVKGVYDGGLQALFLFVDITSRAVFVASDTVQFDVSDIEFGGGVFYPLTISQSGGAYQQTIVILHGSGGGSGKG